MATSATIFARTFPFVESGGLIAFWNMDDDVPGKITDETGNGNNGSIKGEVISSSGFISAAYTFHGTGVSEAHIAIPGKPAFQFDAGQSFTLAAWVKPLRLQKTEEAVLAKSADQGNAYGIWIKTRNRWVFRGPKGDLEGPEASEGAWTHIAVVQNAETKSRRMYLNGAPIKGTAPAQPADGKGEFWMGQQNIPGHPESFPGIIDEVRLYNRALADAEIPTLLGPPLFEARLSQTDPHGNVRVWDLWPPVKGVALDDREVTPGECSIVLHFSAPVSNVEATLRAQDGKARVLGSVTAVQYDSVKRSATLILSGLQPGQSLVLELEGIQPGNGTLAIPFKLD